MTTQRIANWLKGFAWFGVFCAFIFSGIHAADDRSSYQFQSIAVFFVMLVLALSIHFVCAFIIDLGHEKGFYAYRKSLVFVVGSMFLICLSYVVFLLMA